MYIGIVVKSSNLQESNLCTFTVYVELVAHHKSYHLRLALMRRLNLQLGSYT